MATRSGVTNLKEIERALTGLARQLPKETMGLVIRQVTLVALQGVVDVSPVDTGRLRAGWILSAGVPSTIVPAEGSHPTGPAVVSAGFGVLQNADPFGKLWITNNVPYVEVYELGLFRPRNPGPSKRDRIVKIQNGYHVSAPRGFLHEAGVRIRNSLRRLK